MYSRLKYSAVLSFFFVLILLFQNCSPLKIQSTVATNKSTGDEPGDGFKIPDPAGPPYSGPINFTSNSEAYKSLCSNSPGIGPLAFCPLPQVNVPGVGGSYYDPVFGSKITTVVDGALHHYSFQSPFSKTSKYIVVTNTLQKMQIYRLSDRTLYWEPEDSGPGMGDFRWSNQSDEVAYLTYKNKIVKVDLEQKRQFDYIDFSSEPYSLGDAETGGNHDLAADDWTAFFSLGKKKVCVIHLPRKEGRCLSYDPSPWTAEMKTSPQDRIDLNLAKNFDSETKRLYVVLYANPGSGVFSIDHSLSNFRFDFTVPEITEDMKSDGRLTNDYDGVCEAGEECLLYNTHNDIAQDSTGRQFFFPVFVSKNCVLTRAFFQISKGKNMAKLQKDGGGKFEVDFPLNRCGGASIEWTWADHVGCSQDSPHCVVSVEYNDIPVSPAPGREPKIYPNRANYYSELFLIKDLGREIKRLGTYRSLYYDYWASPRPGISKDGKLVLFDSNYGVKDKPKVMLLETQMK